MTNFLDRYILLHQNGFIKTAFATSADSKFPWNMDSYDHIYPFHSFSHDTVHTIR